MIGILRAVARGLSLPDDTTDAEMEALISDRARIKYVLVGDDVHPEIVMNPFHCAIAEARRHPEDHRCAVQCPNCLQLTP